MKKKYIFAELIRNGLLAIKPLYIVNIQGQTFIVIRQVVFHTSQSELLIWLLTIEKKIQYGFTVSVT